MSLKQQIDGDIKQAMLAKDKDSLRALRAVKSLILLAESEKGNEGELTPERELNLLMKSAKQRKESAEVYKQQGREDLAETELIELKIIENYLPKQLSDDDLKAELQEIISKVGASGPSDMGKVMGVASKQLSGKADGKRISTAVKELLA